MPPHPSGPLGRVLIAGTGPTAIQLAGAVKNVYGSTVGIAGRESVRSSQFFDNLRAVDGAASVRVQNIQHEALAADFRFDASFEGYPTVSGEWDTLILAAPANAYAQILREIDAAIGFAGITLIVLVSPTLGSGALVAELSRSSVAAPEVISLSSYLGDTRWASGIPGPTVLTAGVKNRIYAASDRGRTRALDAVRGLHVALGIDVEVFDDPIAAESRNPSLYVHPALFFNDVTLGAVFDDPVGPQRYVYKLFPEGPITPGLIATMLGQWREMSAILAAVGVPGVNLLRFMVDDSYPVRPESISREDIENFESLTETEQCYLVYVRYASLLIDPFSTPDADGRYFDFSAVPIGRVFTDATGVLDIPRMPGEDYYRTKVIRGIAARAGIECPAIDGMLACYEGRLRTAAGKYPDRQLSPAFTVQEFDGDVQLIWNRLRERIPRGYRPSLRSPVNPPSLRSPVNPPSLRSPVNPPSLRSPGR
ncbi:DUF2338 family protein [Gordonia pseudamarae]|nr:opine metallophore biosynthesis dehydrogenase [Gordonia sp. (in: high G+C Gram-positive bacteria)]QHN28864.1 DUF2338 family protein [Gordonia pseudamarae]